MKKIISHTSILVLVVISMFVTHRASAQNEKLAFGLQYQTLTYGLSAKYNINMNSAIQATINPISTNNLNLNFYGGRYYYNFAEGGDHIVPYLFAGAGIISYKYELAKLTSGYVKDISGSFFGYNAGGGLSGRPTKNLELSLDLGYGKLNVEDGLSIAGLNLGFGIHYYIN
ncbi:outer membrane protein [Aquirufa aurantiipilula]|uniref:outer membrane protein n=1 Tax=Aquirufa aurantiipilula TaxID=2696561 RepID=UPI001CAA71F4|nr:porin family protein [Aquirufa aurantiipilula]MBZ1326551.1 porin family protein [Aquirufa aurantiipilula]